ncbi:MAG: hypothetical protein BM565_06570 [Gammaproteobacteria bacterium MedPE]|nr:MAG: hypothetical protein BM565_06570 [Gammaproteobacteria bacterium MedPE]
MSINAYRKNSSNFRIGAIVLAGGKSSRMGKDKASLVIDKLPLVYRLQEMLTSLGLSVVISSKRFGLTDIIPDKGPLGGCYTAMTALRHCHHVIVIPVDMVHLNKDILVRLLQEITNKNLATITKCNDQHFPLIIKNTESVMSWLLQTLLTKEGRACSIGALLQRFDTHSISIEDCASYRFDNVNTPSQWCQALGIIEQGLR